MLKNNIFFAVLMIIFLANDCFSQNLPVPDFHLLDVNTNSPTYNQLVSPRDYLGTTPAWYFSRAT
jgi:hypothetical protein